MDPTRAEDEHEDEVSNHPNPISIRSRRNHSPRACCVCRTSRAAGVPATMTYSAPELVMTSLRSGSSGSRSAGLKAADIYSLGIVFLELFCVFGTRMERAVLVTELKKTGVIPRVMTEQYPSEAIFLARLLDVDPNRRPTASQILQEELPYLFAKYRVLSMSPGAGDVVLTMSPDAGDVLTISDEPFSISSDSSATSLATSFGSPVVLTKMHMSWTPRPHNGLRRWRSLSCTEKGTASTFMNGSIAEAERRRPVSCSAFAYMPTRRPDDDKCRDPCDDRRSTMQDQSHSLEKVSSSPHEPTTNCSSAGTVAGSSSLLNWFFRGASYSDVATALNSPQQPSQGFLEPSKLVEPLKHHASCHSMSSLDELSFKDEIIERLQQDLQEMKRKYEMAQSEVAAAQRHKIS
ncbi:hypothetical protein BC937DRAFT_86276 [Endogone sp. FLAS-F59071]|nr:hypothetical protein BC937DRAFT_86276 [Endogone sp. FLAS-F59071]|eukprot:RUS13140.1 hypothetical protein BC937DRAFT_86276 [Endogone sp. FLAS-F59071]